MDTYNNSEFIAYGLELTPIIIALVGLATQLHMPTKFAPLLSLLLGIGFSFTFLTTVSWQEKLLKGIVLGLTSNGLHSGIKNIAQSVPQKNPPENNDPFRSSDDV